MPTQRYQRSPLEVAFYIILGSLLGLALLITLRPDLNPTLLVPRAFASRERATLQGGIWTTYANGDAVQAMAIQGDYLWVGTYLGGLVRWDMTDETYVQYLYPQTGLPSNDVRAVDIDGEGRIWVGTDRGLAVLSSDGSTIVVHHTGNSGLPADQVTDVGVASDDRVWIATDGGGVAVLDDKGTTEDLSDDVWTIYGSDVLPSYLATALAFDEVGNVWIGTQPYPNPDPQGQVATIGGGVCIFDGTRCSTYTSDSSTMGSNVVVTLHAGGGNKMWVATRGSGVTLFEGKQTNRTFNKSNSGLAANYVSAIVQDAAGKMWFAVADSGGVGKGVSVLNDGFWATLTTSNSGLISNNVDAILADNSRRVWFGIEDVRGGVQGVSVLSATGDGWTTYDMTTSHIPTERINSISLDTQGDLWFGSNGQGAVQYQRAFNRWRPYDRNTTGDGLPSNFVRDITTDQLGRLWLATDKGGSVRSGSWTAYTPETTENKLRNDNLRAVAVDAVGQIWFGHAQGIDQVNHHGTPNDLSDDQWRSFTAVLPGMNVRDIERDASGRMWVATNGGVGVYDGALWTTYRTADGLPSNDVQVIFPDSRTDQVWAGTAQGASVFDEETGIWTPYTTTSTEGGLVGNDIRAIYVDGWERVWFAVADDEGRGQGVSIKDGDEWFSYTTANSGLVANDVTSILVDGWGLVWLGTGFDGVSAFDSSEWDDFAFADHGMPSNRVTDIAFGADGSVWVATADRGLSVLHGTTWTTYSRASTEGQLPSDKVRSIAIAADGQVWVGTLPFIDGGQYTGGGVSVLDPKSGSWTTYNQGNTGPTGLKGNFIQKIAIDAAGRVWIGTGVPTGEATMTLGFGLTLFDGGSWTTYTRGNTVLGLSSDRIPDIAFDSQDRVWLATQPYVAGASLVGGGVSRLDLGDNGVPDPPGQDDDVWTSWANDDDSGLAAIGIKGDMRSIHVDQADTAWAGSWTCNNPPNCENIHWPKRRGVHGSLNEFTGSLWTAGEPYVETGPVSSIASNAYNNLWVGTLWGGARYLDGQGWHSFTTAGYPLVSDEITAIRVDPQGDVWFGTANAGISQYKPPPPTPTPTPSNTPTETSTPDIRTPTATETATATMTPTVTETPTPTNTATGRETETPTVTVTVEKTLTPTGTTVTGSATPSPTATGTEQAKPTHTPTSTPTGTPNRPHRLMIPLVLNRFHLSQFLTPTSTATHTATPTRTGTATQTATATATPRESFTLTPSATSTETATPMITETPTSTATSTSTVTLTPSQTATVTETPTPSQTPTVTETPTVTATPTPTVPPSWHRTTVGTTDLNDVFFVDADTGWIVRDALNLSDRGTILKSTDGGYTWQVQNSCKAGVDLNAVFFVDADEGWAAGDSETMCHTSDGGATWSQQQLSRVFSHDVTALFMLSSTDGWAGTMRVDGDGAILHYDGTSWSLFDSSRAFQVTAIHMLTATEGWATSSAGRVLHYANGYWALGDQLSPLWDLDLVSSTLGWAVGDNRILQFDGSRWSEGSPPPVPLYGVDMVAEDDGWAVGYHGLRMHYDGSNWQQVDVPTLNNTLNAIQMWSASQGWAVGESGTILRYGSP